MPHEDIRIAHRKLVFDDPRLRMTIPGRMTVRVVSLLGWSVLAAATATFLFSYVEWLSGIGMLAALFLADRLIHRSDPDKFIYEAKHSGSVNVAAHLAPRAFGALERAYERSSIMETDVALEILHHLTSFSEIKECLNRLDVRMEEWKQRIELLLTESASGERSKNKETRRAALAGIAVAAFEDAEAHRHLRVDIDDLFAVLPLGENEYVERLRDAFSLRKEDFGRAALFTRIKREVVFAKQRGVFGSVFGSGGMMPHRVMNRAWTARPTRTLDTHGRDLSDLVRAGSGGALVGHANEYERLVEALSRPVRPNALLVGESGIGKEAMVLHLASRIEEGDIPEALSDKRVVELDIASLIAGADEGVLQERLRRIVEEILRAGNIILYVPNIHTMLHASGAAYLSVADAFMPVVGNDAFPVIGATFPREYAELVEPRSDITSAFEVIRIGEVSEADAEKILVFEGLELERANKMLVSFGAIREAVRLGRRFEQGKHLPSCAEELLKEAVSSAARRGTKMLAADDVVRIVEERVHAPLHTAGKEEAARLLRFEEEVHKSFVGQEEAVKAIGNALREFRSGLTRSGGPIASFLFVGPSGVGKTELGKTVARLQFGSEEAMIRFDMGEFLGAGGAAKLIGSSETKTPGALTEAVLAHPYALVLLDEIEKAPADLPQIFLRILDEGRVTDYLGRTIDFSNTIIVATSNAHSDIMRAALAKGESMEGVGEYVKARLSDVFKPELLNRFSRIIIFRDLKINEVEAVARFQLADVARHAEEKGIRLSFSDDAVRFVARKGYDPASGARPLRAVIEDRVRAKLAEAMLQGSVKRGDEAELVLRGEKLVFEKRNQ